MDKTEHQKTLLKFYKYESYLLGAMAIWPLNINSKKHFYYLRIVHFYGILLIFIIMFNISCIVQLIKYITDLDEVIKVFFIFATSFAVLVKFISIKRNNHLYQLWLDIIKATIFRPRNTQEKILFQHKIRSVNTIRTLYILCSLTALTNILIYRNNELPLAIYIPFNTDKRWNFFVLYLYQCMAAFTCCCINMGFDSYVISALSHLKCQLDILCNRLENLSEHDITNPNIMDQLKSAIKFYDEVLKLARLIENLITIPITIQIACSILVLVANLYVLSFQSDDYAKFINILSYQICMLMQIYLLCYYPGEVTARSQLISYALYSSKWCKWTKEQRKFTLMLLHRFDVPIQFRSINPTYIFNIGTFSSIINSSYSYFALLKRFNN